MRILIMNFLLPFKRVPKIILALTLLALIPVGFNLILNRLFYIRIFVWECCEAFTLAYIFGWLMVVMGRKGRMAFVSVYAALSFVASMFVVVSMRPLTTESLTLVLQTDGREARSFITQFVSAKTIMLAAGTLLLYGLILWWAFTKRTFIRFRIGLPSKIVFSVILMVIFGMGIYRLAVFSRIYAFDDVYDFEQWYSQPSDVTPAIMRLVEYRNGELITNILFTVQGLYLNTKEMPEWEKTQRAIVSAGKGADATADSINVVIIIGESFIKGHSNLYGYPLETNPRLTSERDAGRLVAFNDFISTANYTAESLRNTMNLNDLSKGERWSRSAFFPLVAAMQGWKVHLYDNQVTKPTHISDIQLSAMMRNPILEQDSYEWSNDSIDRYDGDFVSRVNREHPFDNSTGNLDIFHLYGQHFAPGDRYPKDVKYNRWTGDSIPYQRPWFDAYKRQVVAEYDNATLYNDGVVGAIISRYENTPAVIIYFSDHGEEMFDASNCDVRNEPSGDFKGWLQRQFEIPFFVMATDSYIESHPGVWENIRNAANRPGMLDNLGQIVLGLCGITGPEYYRATRDILNPEYQPSGRITSTKGLNYDELVKGE